MRSLKRSTGKDWARLALKLGLVATSPKIWEAINDQLSDGVDEVGSRLSRGFEDISDKASRKYEQAAERLSAASDALQGRSSSLVPIAGFLIGIGVGAGIGILLAPAAGSETRELLRDKAVEAKNKAVQSVSNATDRLRQSVPITGTGGD